METNKYVYYYPENIELRKEIRRGDIKLIARASKKSEGLIIKIYSGTRKMKPEVRRVHDTVVRFNRELEKTLGFSLEPEASNTTDKKPNI
jgi:hypothetical protein